MMMGLTLVAAAAVGAGLLPTGNTIVCEDARNLVFEADKRADAAWEACTTPAKLAAHQREVRAAVVKALGGFPERTPLNPVVTGRVQRDGYAIEKVMFESRPSFHVTAHLFLPDPVKFPGRRPAVVVPCGHSLNGKAAHGYQRGCVKAALRGIVALVYDPIDQGERRQCRGSGEIWNCEAHNNIGVRAELLGASAASFRLWDGMRALDYLETRAEVDAKRLGVMGHSGGGTMTSWIMCLDDRIRCAAPSGFLSTMREVCRTCGPQDAEQFVFGELTMGFNHLGHILLRAPSPVLHCSSHGDFFPFSGVLDTADLARRIYAAVGAPDAYRLSDIIGPHSWHEGTSSYAVDWMDHWLQGAPLTRTMADYRAQQYGFSFYDVDSGLAYSPKSLANMRKQKWEASVTKNGCTLDLPGERTAYDVMAETAARQRAARPSLSVAAVRRLAGIRPTSEIGFKRVAEGLLTMDDATPVPYCTEGTGERVLLVTDDPTNAVSVAGQVTRADLRGFGATAKTLHRFYGYGGDREEIARLYALVGVNLVAKRAEDLIAVAKACGGRMKLVAEGSAAVPAAHAWFVARELFTELKLVNPPVSWGTLFENDAKRFHFADIVFGAWKLYDWTDLVDARP